ncbi:unnamed protein product, partial [marine sediment metagenome]
MATGIVHKSVVGHGQKGLASEWNDNHEINDDYDCEKNQALNFVLENRDTYPAGPVVGQMIFRTDFPNGFLWNGTSWRSLTPAQLVVVANDGTGDFLTIQEGIDSIGHDGG